MKNLERFTNLYQVQKTLRFELKPIGKTLENINEKGLIKEDEHRAESYKKVKEIIDEYHKDFIELALEDFELEGLVRFEQLYLNTNKNNKEKKEFEKLQKDLRKQIAKRFSKHPDDEIKIKFKNLFKKELIKQDLISWEKIDDDKLKLVREFENFTTYFTNFHKNRQNIYSEEDKSTAISYRLIHENLPKFIDNLKIYNTMKTKFTDFDFYNVEEELEEILQGISLDEVFSIEFFNNILSQNGIDFYNSVLGGFSNNANDKKKGLNEFVNLFRQREGLNKKKLPNLSELYKQILSDRSSISFLPENFEDDNEVLDSISEYYNSKIINFFIEDKSHNLFDETKNLLTQINSFDTSKIYVRNDRSITDISNFIFESFSVIHDALRVYYSNEISSLKNTKKYEEDREKFVKRTPYFSIKVLEDALEYYKDEHEEVNKFESKHLISDYFTQFEKKNKEGEKVNIIENIKEQYQKTKDLLNTDYPDNKNLIQDTDAKEKIKNLLDSFLDIIHYLKPLAIGLNEENKDIAFYNFYTAIYDQFNFAIPLYNKTRNYLTQKPYSKKKIKLNFQNSTLLSGWDKNKEKDNTSVLLKKDGLFYLAIMDVKNRKAFDKEFDERIDNYYEKIDYKLLPGANKMLPKVFFSKSRIKEFNPSDEILSIYSKGSHKKGDNFKLKDCHKLIDFFKASLNKHPDWKNFDFDFSKTSSYKDLSDFYREVEKSGYKITYRNIPTDYIDKLVEDGKIYLFQIYNKDFSEHSKGKPNLHTIYWRMLFDKENLKDVVYKLNGEAEVFFREKSLNKKELVIHKANQPIKRRGDGKEKSLFKYDIIKNKRFSVDKFQFHVPVTMNFKAKGVEYVNDEVNSYLKNNSDINIIGIDRGERHLIYVSVINQKGKILEQFSLNEIINKNNGIDSKTNYHKLLDDKEEQRKKAKVNWGTIENIKELKEGYISQVVHKISELIVKYNAIVVLEDLNFGFKRGRFKVEKQVYQKFESMLISKLNYLIFKDTYDLNKITSPLKALQLTSKFGTFKNLSKQTGFVFYLPAALTSKIDPETGFVNFFYDRYENRDKARKFFSSFDSISYNKKEEYFEFVFDYNNFTKRAEGTKTNWKICTTNIPRYQWRRSLNNNRGGYIKIMVSEQIEDLFAKNNIIYGEGKDLREQICAQESADFYKELLFLFKLTANLRHNNGKKGKLEEDSILSPVGKFFNSSEASEGLPVDADANGAYHIALKGLWALNKINSKEEIKTKDLKISNKEWLDWVQKRPFEK